MSYTDILLRLLAAFAAGGAVGLERQIHGRPAGLRTHILVCTGACIAICAGILAIYRLPGIQMDAGRIAAGIITGVGFLGAGTIVHYREGVGGLTTAACIWFVAMTGMLAGFGFFVFTALATALAMVVLLLLDMLEDRMPSARYWKLSTSFGNRSHSSADGDCRRVFRDHGVSVKSSTASISSDSTEMVFILRTRNMKNGNELIEAIRGLEGIRTVKWSHRTEAL